MAEKMGISTYDGKLWP